MLLPQSPVPCESGLVFFDPCMGVLECLLATSWLALPEPQRRCWLANPTSQLEAGHLPWWFMCNYSNNSTPSPPSPPDPTPHFRPNESGLCVLVRPMVAHTSAPHAEPPKPQAEILSGGVAYHAGSCLLSESRGPGILAEVSRILAAASRGDPSAGCRRQALRVRNLRRVVERFQGSSCKLADVVLASSSGLCHSRLMCPCRGFSSSVLSASEPFCFATGRA